MFSHKLDSADWPAASVAAAVSFFPPAVSASEGGGGESLWAMSRSVSETGASAPQPRIRGPVRLISAEQEVTFHLQPPLPPQ